MSGTISGNPSISLTTTRYILTDHLGGTGIVTDGGGIVLQTLDYYPYGVKRISSGTDVSQREYIGEHFDESTDLSYLNARYLRSERGQFLSQDPVFWSYDTASLVDPQNQNSYGYARGNPITLSDPTGQQAVSPLGIFLMILFYPRETSYDPEYEQAEYNYQNSPERAAQSLAMGLVSGGGGKGKSFNNTLVKNSAGELSNVYRAGEINIGPDDFKTTLRNGVIDPSLAKVGKAEGVSVNTNIEKMKAMSVEKKMGGKVTPVLSVPKGITLTQSGNDKGHYVIQPGRKMTQDVFKGLVAKMKERISKLVSK